MIGPMRLISYLTLLLAVVLPSLALFVLENKNLARILFVVVLVVGYGVIFAIWYQGRGKPR